MNGPGRATIAPGKTSRGDRWHGLSLALGQEPTCSQVFGFSPQWLKDLISPNPSLLGEETRPSKQRCSRVPWTVCSSSSARGEGQSPTRVTSDPLTLHIKASSCLPGTTSPVWWEKPLQQRILGRALVPWDDRQGTLGSQNSQEAKYWEQQQQQKRQGAGGMLSTPPRCATFSRAPNRMD